jgi:molybdenum cofactor biosynthesis enzyme MoaA
MAAAKSKRRVPCATRFCANCCAKRASSTRASSACLAASSVIDIFLDEESQGLAMLSDFIGKPISLKAEPSYSQEQYDIVLM